jgi:hypothetical protein
MWMNETVVPKSAVVEFLKLKRITIWKVEIEALEEDWKQHLIVLGLKFEKLVTQLNLFRILFLLV